MNLDDLIALSKPRTKDVPICLDGNLVDLHAAAVQRLDQATRADDSLAGGPEVATAADAVVKIEEQIEAATVTFVLSSVPRQTWADLLADHGPSKEQRRAGLGYDPVTFPVAAVAASLTEPDLSEQDVTRLTGDEGQLPESEFAKLWWAALELNTVPTRQVPKLAAATELVRANGQSSTTAVPEESPEAGSLAGSGEQ